MTGLISPAFTSFPLTYSPHPFRLAVREIIFKFQNSCPVGIFLYVKRTKKSTRGPAWSGSTISPAHPRGTRSRFQKWIWPRFDLQEGAHTRRTSGLKLLYRATNRFTNVSAITGLFLRFPAYVPAIEKANSYTFLLRTRL